MSRLMDSPATRRDDVAARIRPDEEPLGKATHTARLRGSHQQKRTLRKAKKHGRKSRRS
jgi:hypothetical protein